LRNIDADDRYPFRVVRMSAMHMPVKNYFKHLRVCSLFPGNYSTLAALARETRAQVVLLVNHYLDIAFPAIFAAKRARVPLVCSVGTQLQSPNPFRHRVLTFLDQLICGGIVYPACTRIVSWDDQITRYLRDVHGDGIVDKISLVNYGVNGDPRRFTDHRHEYAMHGQILGVGAVIEQRDFTALVEAFGLISTEFPSLRLKIIGHVYYDRAVRLAADLGLADRVTFTDELPHDQVLEELGRSDAYFASLTGRYVGLGTATIEAMLMGVPTVVNAYAGILGRAILRDMHDAVLLPSLAPPEIAGRLRTLLADAALRERIGRGGQAFVSEHMSWSKVAEDLEAVLESAVATSRAARGATG
jgi:glycosyltransferase involved in cell wall biosynthesis